MRRTGHRKGRCPKCKRYATLTRHHIFPVRWYKKTPARWWLWLCRKCHDDLERLIPFERRDDGFYLRIVQSFLS